MSSAQQAESARGPDRVRHVSTGDVGTLHRVDRTDESVEWALVRWHKDGPGMRDAQGLSRIAPGLLVRVRDGSQVRGQHAQRAGSGGRS